MGGVKKSQNLDYVIYEWSHSTLAKMEKQLAAALDTDKENSMPATTQPSKETVDVIA